MPSRRRPPALTLIPLRAAVLLAAAPLAGTLAAQGGERATTRPAAVPTDAGFVVGRADAPFEVVEFLDPGCSACAQFDALTWPALRREFVETGRVRWRIVPFVLRRFPHSAWAAEVIACAGEQGTAEAVLRGLLAERGAWSVPSVRPPHAQLRRIAGAAGADTAALSACTESGRRRDVVRADSDLARRLGIWGTPTFVFPDGRRALGALPDTTFRALLELVIGEGGAASRP